jgi:hypothetical protein
MLAFQRRGKQPGTLDYGRLRAIESSVEIGLADHGGVSLGNS